MLTPREALDQLLADANDHPVLATLVAVLTNVAMLVLYAHGWLDWLIA